MSGWYCAALRADSTPPDGNPYVVDAVDGRLVLVDQGGVIETVQFVSVRRSA
jgi:hypothetical protein